MKYLQPSFTMPQQNPNPAICCEACVYGRGEHAEWCMAPRPGTIVVYPLAIPADCEFCPSGECGEFEAVGSIDSPDGPAVCSKCLARMFTGAVEVERFDAVVSPGL